VRVPLCASGKAIDLTGKNVGYYVHFVTAADSPEPLTNATVYVGLYSGATTFAVLKITAQPDGVAWAASAGNAISPDNTVIAGQTVLVTHVGLLSQIYHAWKGTIYIDDVLIF
jgi:hypothetical protein